VTLLLYNQCDGLPSMTSSIGSYSVLEIERDRLQRALHHLEKSVIELKSVINEAGPDPDYKDAIDENVTVIAKYRARIAALDDEITRLKGIKADISSSMVAAVPVSDIYCAQDSTHQISNAQQPLTTVAGAAATAENTVPEPPAESVEQGAHHFNHNLEQQELHPEHQGSRGSLLLQSSTSQAMNMNDAGEGDGGSAIHNSTPAAGGPITGVWL